MAAYKKGFIKVESYTNHLVQQDPTPGNQYSAMTFEGLVVNETPLSPSGRLTMYWGTNNIWVTVTPEDNLVQHFLIEGEALVGHDDYIKQQHVGGATIHVHCWALSGFEKTPMSIQFGNVKRTPVNKNASIGSTFYTDVSGFGVPGIGKWDWERAHMDIYSSANYLSRKTYVRGVVSCFPIIKNGEPVSSGLALGVLQEKDRQQFLYGGSGDPQVSNGGLMWASFTQLEPTPIEEDPLEITGEIDGTYIEAISVEDIKTLIGETGLSDRNVQLNIDRALVDTEMQLVGKSLNTTALTDVATYLACHYSITDGRTLSMNQCEMSGSDLDSVSLDRDVVPATDNYSSTDWGIKAMHADTTGTLRYLSGKQQ